MWDAVGLIFNIFIPSLYPSPVPFTVSVRNQLMQLQAKPIPGRLTEAEGWEGHR